MTIATTSSTARQSVLKHVPELALALAGVAVVLLALGPIGWRLGWWHFRFSLLTLMPWPAYVGLAAVIVSALALVIGLSRRDGRGIALALVALIGGGLIAYVPWHYDQLRQTLPPIHDITTDPVIQSSPADLMSSLIRAWVIMPRSPTRTTWSTQPPFQIEHLHRGAQSDPQQGLRRQQRDVVAGGAIDLDEVAEPEILDPRRVVIAVLRLPEVILGEIDQGSRSRKG